MNKNRIFSLARNASLLSDFPRQKLGCVIIYRNQIISIGFSTTKENPIQKQYNKFRNFDVDKRKNSLHAEMMALNKIKYLDIEWSKAIICVYREFKNGKIANAKPCISCMTAIRDFGINKVYYTTNNGYCCEKII